MPGEVRQTTPEDEADSCVGAAKQPTRVGSAEYSDAVGVPSNIVVFGLLDEATLVERAKTQPDAFAALYERHVRSIFAFAMSKEHDAALAEDITSHTFLKALHALPRYEQRGAPFKSWLFRIAANLIADLHRSTHVEIPLPHRSHDNEAQDEAEIVDPQAEEDIAAWERAEEFARLITDLTTEQQSVVQMRFVEGLSIAAISERMARSEGAVKMLMMRALQNLRRTLTLETYNAG